MRSRRLVKASAMIVRFWSSGRLSTALVASSFIMALVISSVLMLIPPFSYVIVGWAGSRLATALEALFSPASSLDSKGRDSLWSRAIRPPLSPAACLSTPLPPKIIQLWWAERGTLVTTDRRGSMVERGQPLCPRLFSYGGREAGFEPARTGSRLSQH